MVSWCACLTVLQGLKARVWLCPVGNPRYSPNHAIPRGRRRGRHPRVKGAVAGAQQYEEVHRAPQGGEGHHGKNRVHFTGGVWNLEKTEDYVNRNGSKPHVNIIIWFHKITTKKPKNNNKKSKLKLN